MIDFFKSVVMAIFFLLPWFLEGLSIHPLLVYEHLPFVQNFDEKLPSNGTGIFLAPKTGTGLSCTIYKILVNFSLSLDMKPGTSNPDKWYRKISNPLCLTFFRKSCSIIIILIVLAMYCCWRNNNNNNNKSLYS